MFTLRVFQKDAELSSLLLVRAAAEYQVSIYRWALPIVAVGAVSAAIFGLLLALPLCFAVLPYRHSLNCGIKRTLNALLGYFLKRLVYVVAMAELLDALTLRHDRLTAVGRHQHVDGFLGVGDRERSDFRLHFQRVNVGIIRLRQYRLEECLDNVYLAVEALQETAAFVLHFHLCINEKLLSAFARQRLLGHLLIGPIGELQLSEEHRTQLIHVEFEVFNRLRPRNILRR